MLFADKTLAEIAGYDDLQMRYLLFRPRDQYGRLKSRVFPGLPSGVEVDADGMRIVSAPVPYAAMYQQVMRRRFGKEAAQQKWQEFLATNPGYARFSGPG